MVLLPSMHPLYYIHTPPPPHSGWGGGGVRGGNHNVTGQAEYSIYMGKITCTAHAHQALY